MICVSCGQENPEGFSFCGACGAALEEPAADVRKVVTVVFCDLVGSTALGDRADPEVLRERMTRYHAELRTILERHGGNVEKFVGDAAMAVFGLPQVHEDDALRAVRAAVEMRAAVGVLGLEVRIGINTGEVVAGSGETLVTGDAVNVAARLEQAAAAGEIVLGPETERLVRHTAEVDAVEPLALKGKADRVPAFRVVGLVEEIPAFTRPIDRPFVGRGADLARLESALTIAVDSRTPQLATIAGPPGIGKSRLARELVGRADARVVVGRCLPYGEGITYWPIQEIVTQVGDVRVALADASDAELVSLRLEAALGLTDTPVSPEEIAWGVRRLVEAMADRRPVVAVFDDIHWAEPALLDLVEYVSTFARDVPLFVLCTARPDLFDVRPSWTAPKPNATLLVLDPLSDSDSDALVDELSDLAAETRQRIVRAAEGNPLFVEQFVAMQAESGNGELEIPPSLRALLAARVDRLTEPERTVIERGAIEGRLFHRGAVATLMPEPDRAEVGTHLLSLVRKELIRPDRAIVPGDDAFRFGHILIREAAYEAVPKRQRAALHERYADWLEASLGEDAPDEVVGYHLEQAYRYGVELGVVDTTVGRRAAEKLGTAGQEAMARQDMTAAVNLLTRALDLVPDAEARPLLCVRLGEALEQADELARAEAAYEEGVALARENGDGHAEWLGRVWLARVKLMQDPEGALENMLQEATAAVAARESAGDYEVLAAAWGRIAAVHSWRGETAMYLDALERALQHARRSGSLALEVSLAGMRAPDFIWGPGRVEEGVRYAEDLVERLGHVPGVQQFALHVYAHMQARLGEFHGALEAISTYRSNLRELGRDREFAITATCVWDVCTWSGDLQHGEEKLREAYELLNRTGNKALLSEVVRGLAEAALARRSLDEAERYCELGEEATVSDDVESVGHVALLRAKIQAAHGDLAVAEQSVRHAIEMYAKTDFLERGADAWLTLGEILRAEGESGDETAAREALALFERKGNVVGAGWVRAFLDGGTARLGGPTDVD